MNQDCVIEDVSEEEEPPSKSSKDKKANGPDAGKPNLVFKITNKVAYKTVLKGTVDSYGIMLSTLQHMVLVYIYFQTLLD